MASALALGYATESAPASSAPEAPPTTAISIRKQVDEVQVTFIVDAGQKPLTRLSEEQFTVFDGNQRVASFTSFGQESDLPLRIGLLVDHSDSMQKGFAQELQAARSFLQRVVRPRADGVFLLDFTHLMKFSTPDLDKGELLSPDLNSLLPQGQTALYDAVFAAARFPLMNARESQPGRRVLILLSDGEDNDSRHSLADALEALQGADIMIYAVTAHGRRYQSDGDEVLEALSETTGGRAFVLNSYSEADAVFATIAQELRSRYTVSFRPPSPGRCGYHRLRVAPRDHSFRVRARAGYYACAR